MRTVSFRPLLWGAFALLAGARIAAADIVIDGDAAFTKQVNDCIAAANKVGGDVAQVITDLETSSKQCVIQKSSKSNSTSYTDPNDANSVGAGGTGKGTNCKIVWDPAYTDAYGDGTPRDPCASLIHEMTHGQDAFNGTRDPRPNGGVAGHEVKACTIENLYRKGKGLRIRTQYGPNKLPASAIPADKDDETPIFNTQLTTGGL